MDEGSRAEMLNFGRAFGDQHQGDTRNECNRRRRAHYPCFRPPTHAAARKGSTTPENALVLPADGEMLMICVLGYHTQDSTRSGHHRRSTGGDHGAPNHDASCSERCRCQNHGRAQATAKLGRQNARTHGKTIDHRRNGQQRSSRAKATAGNKAKQQQGIRQQGNKA